jgi:superfamily II DNA or RNA helicase
MNDLPQSILPLADFVEIECKARLNAYSAQPRDAAEHFETENDVMSGGYAYRQLFELIQNAADAILEEGSGQGRIAVYLTAKHLQVANTGAALDQDGIVALLNARSSSKRGNQIGRFGIGFKSLLKLGGRVDLVSRSVGLRFDPEACRERIRDHLGLPKTARAPGMRLATVVDPSAKGGPLSKKAAFSWATTVVLAEIRDKTAHDRLATEIACFPPEFLLFLPADITLDMEVDGQSPRHFSKRKEGEVVIVGDGVAETRWRLFEKTVMVDDPEAIADATHIQARAQIPLSWAMPLEGQQAGRFWAFFPTETLSRTAGILNAPWKVNSDRTNLVAGEWNKALMREAATLIASALPSLASKTDQGLAVAAFPRQLERQDEIAATLVRALWDKIVVEAILPNAVGASKSPTDLKRPSIESFEIMKRWATLANRYARSEVLHPDCYRDKSRASRINALVEEARQRKVVALPKADAEDWIGGLLVSDDRRAKAVLRLVADLRATDIIFLFGINAVPFILTANGEISSPEKAMITECGAVPTGFNAVASVLAEDPESRKILTDQFKVAVHTGENWAESLRASLAAANSDSAGWQNFWDNISAAPAKVAKSFVAACGVSEFMFPTASGTWQSRGLLVVVGARPDSGLPSANIMAPSFVAKMRSQLPSELLEEFPNGDAPEFSIHEYFQWVKEAYQALALKASGSKPRDPPRLENYYLSMPAGWRLLKILPNAMAVRFTQRLLTVAQSLLDGKGAVTLVARLREDFYPKVKAPHPLIYWLTQYGKLQIGGFYVNLKSVSLDILDALAASGWTDLAAPATLRRQRDNDTAFGKDLRWPGGGYSDEQIKKFWLGLFAEAAQRLVDPGTLQSAWELAAQSGLVPAEIPTPNGPIPVAQAFVTDAMLDDHARSGTALCLTSETAALWWGAGAQKLDGEATYRFFNPPDGPITLLDLNPYLAHALEQDEMLDQVIVLSGMGLEEGRGPVRRNVTLALDGDRVIHVDRTVFAAMTPRAAAEALLKLLIKHMMISETPPLQDRLERLLDRRAENLRIEVRAGEGMEDRIWRAIGKNRVALLEILSPAVRQALTTKKVGDLELVRLALAVHGPSLVSRLRDTMADEGLEPPRRWGGAEARAFVLNLGLPNEFASAISGKRDPEVSVSGPIHLPPLHDFQNAILDDVAKLIGEGTGRRRAVISLPTGGGKTRVAAEAVVRLVLRGDGRRCALWIAQTDELCEQAVQCFRQLWVNVGEPGEDLRIVRFWGGQANPAPPSDDQATLVVASIQTMNARMDSNSANWIKACGIVVLDECHHAITKSYTALMKWLDLQVGQDRAKQEEIPLIGLSATPWRGHDDDASRRLATRFDKRWFPTDQAGLNDLLLQRGVLAKRSYKPLRHDRPVTLSPRDIAHLEKWSELPDDVVERMGEDQERNALILRTIWQSSARSILLFANSVAHAEYLAARLHLMGCAAAAVSGKTDRLARQHFTKRFRSGDLRVICNHSVLTTGFDAPKADLILIARPVFSPVLYMQMVGRGLRGPANGGTEHCTIATVEDNIAAFRDRLAYHFCRSYFD